MKRLFFTLLVAGFLASGSVTAQVIVKVKPVRPKVIVVKPNHHKKGHVWIAGHWSWNKRTHEYHWVTAKWVKARHSQRYVAGHWKTVSGGHRWVSGHWARV
jgi:YXWGXW repeat-containing protein